MSQQDHYDPIEGISPNVSSLSTLFSKIMTSPYKQHVTMMTVGRTGSGKSYAMLYLCEQLAIKIAAIKGGVPEDYFTIDNVGIITKDEVKRVVKTFKKYGIYLLDDIGVGWNAREYKKEGNIILNDIIQTFRPNNNFLGLSLPDGFLIDKVPRSLVHYFMEMEQPLFSRGLTIGKVFRVSRMPRSGDTHYIYLNEQGRYIRHKFRLPSKQLQEEYDRRRDEQYAKLETERMKRWDEIDAPNIKIANKGDVLFDTWVSLKQEGYTLREIGRITHTDHSHISTILKKRGVG